MRLMPLTRTSVFTVDFRSRQMGAPSGTCPLNSSSPARFDDTATHSCGINGRDHADTGILTFTLACQYAVPPKTEFPIPPWLSPKLRISGPYGNLVVVVALSSSYKNWPGGLPAKNRA